MPIKSRDVAATDVQRENDYRSIPARRAKAPQRFDINQMVPSPVIRYLPAGAQILQFTKSLDHGERKKQEQREAQEPRRYRRDGDRSPGKQPQSIEPSKYNNIDQRYPFQRQ